MLSFNSYVYATGDYIRNIATGSIGIFGGGTNAGSNQLVVNNGKVGIGTGSPVAPLQINGAYGSNAALIVNQLNSGDIIAA